MAERVDGPAAGPAGGRGRLAADGWAFLRRRRAVLAALAGWSVLESAQTMLSGYALARAVDAFLSGGTGRGLGWLGAGAAAVLFGAVGTARVYRGLAGLVEPLRDALVRRVVDRGLRDADASAVSRLTHQVEIARDTFAGVVMVCRSFVFTAAGAVAGLLALSPYLLLVVVPPLLLGLLLFAGTLLPMAGAQRRVLAADEAVAAELDLVFRGLRDVTAAGAEDRVLRAVARTVDAHRSAARRLAWWGVPRGAALAAGGQLPVVLLVFAAPWLVDHGVGAGALVGAMTYLTQSLLPALRELAYGFGTGGSRLTVVLRRLAPPAPRSAPAAVPVPAEAAPAAPAPRRPAEVLPRARAAAADSPAVPEPGGGTPAAVRLRGVTFAYGPGARPVLRGLDLTVPAGGHLAVVGPSGIGKSTLTGLVAGMLTPAAGEVLLCGRPAGDPRAAALRVLIPQEAYVFTGTPRENLGYLLADEVPATAYAAAVAALGLGEVLARAGGLDGRLDPDRLSAGERQLVALARAWLSPAPVALLDEATCHLDPAAEARAERAFAARPHGTLIVVAHRVSSAARADRVLVMDGTDAVCGRHRELLARSPLYRDLVGAWDGADQVASQPAGATGDTDGVHPVAGAGLAVDGGHVVAHGAVAQVQAARDLPHGGPLGGE